MTLLVPPPSAVTRRTCGSATIPPLSSPVRSRARAARHEVEAGPFRAWIRQLMSDTGLPWRVLARAAGVPSATVHALLQGGYGRRLTALMPSDAERLFRLDHRRLEYLSQAPAEPQRMRMLLWSLAMAGCTNSQLIEFSGIDSVTVRMLMAGDTAWCSRLHELRAEAACEAWGIDPRMVSSGQPVSSGFSR